jgi:hypothetical protein
MKELERGAPLVENLDEQGDAPEPEAIRSRGVSLLFSAAGTSRRCASDKTNRTGQIGPLTRAIEGVSTLSGT